MLLSFSPHTAPFRHCHCRRSARRSAACVLPPSAPSAREARAAAAGGAAACGTHAQRRRAQARGAYARRAARRARSAVSDMRGSACAASSVFALFADAVFRCWLTFHSRISFCRRLRRHFLHFAISPITAFFIFHFSHCRLFSVYLFSSPRTHTPFFDAAAMPSWRHAFFVISLAESRCRQAFAGDTPRVFAGVRR